MQMELDAINPLRNLSASAALAGRGISAVEFMNNSSLFSTSRAMQEALASMKPFGNYLTGGARADYLQRITSIPESVHHIMETLSCTSAMKETIALRDIAGIGTMEHMNKIIGGATFQSLRLISDSISGIHEIGKSIAERASIGLGAYDAIRKEMDASFLPLIARQASLSLLWVNAFQESLGFRMSSVQTALKAMHQSRVFSDTDYIAKVIGTLTPSQVFRDSIIALNQKGAFQEALNHYNSITYAFPDEAEFPDDELADILTQLETVERGSFLEFFRKLPPFVQTIIIFIFLQTIWPMVINIASSLITPQVERMINGGKLNSDQINTIKKLPASQGIDCENLRFITRNNVKLRAKASTKSEVLDELVVGQVVKVMGKKKNWAEVIYRYEDGQAFHGWILTTYTVKFKFPGRFASIGN